MSAHGITVAKVTVTFSPEQIDWLNWIASARSTSVSDIIRRLIDETRGAYLTPPDARVSSDEVTPIDGVTIVRSR
jgi:hypothetical protein